MLVRILKTLPEPRQPYTSLCRHCGTDKKPCKTTLTGSTRSLTRPASVASQRRTRKENLWQQLPFSPRSFAHRRTDAAWPKHADGTFVCLSPAAKQGDADARCSLGVCYDSGKGVQQDKKEAVQRYRKAAEQGDADAQFNLAHTHTHTQ